MLATPWKYSAAVQNLEKDGGLIRIPRCQIEIARFLNEQSNIQDRIQANNSSLVYSAFSGRQNWIAMFYRRLPQQYAEHMQSFERLMQSESPTDIINFMHSNKIHYFIAEPGALTKWNQFFNKQILYQCQDYRIFQFK